MQTECIPITDFVHNEIRAYQDRPIMLPDGLAGDLEKRGLVRIKFARVIPVRVDPVRAAIAGNSPAVGRNIPSSVSPAAPASQPMTTQTLHLPRRGETQRKTGTR